MRIKIRQGRLFRREMRTRMPFRYGIATVTGLPHLFVRLSVLVDGVEQTGLAADHLAPKWFTKNPEATPEYDIAEMLTVIRQALLFAEGQDAETPFDLWRGLYERQAAWGAREGLAPLLTNFGVSLIERAMLDAVCRAAGRPFAALLRENTFGIRLGDLRPELAGSAPADYLPEAPLPRILCRHTVGLIDPLTDADIPEGERLTDGLPQSLTACIREYGLRHFKLKVGGNPEGDTERLARIVATIAENVPDDDWAFSMDGNESYASVADFRAFWEAVRRHPMLAPRLSRHLLFVEQPMHRRIALSAEVGAAFADWPDRPPLIIDESDGALSDLPTALSLGYVGTSHKNCKGVFKGIRNACVLKKMGGLLSGEDLSNVGPVALLQDMAVQAALGIESVERNGQHYFAGLSMFPQEFQDAMQSAHPDLYRRTASGFPTLAIENGHTSLGTVNAAPFGLAADFDPARYGEDVTTR
jgi:L-alanine-DL-glutamate epimerase-like enolase superfamily enzyme